MKKLTILFVAVLFISCTKTKEEKMQENITTEFKKDMNDPSTFEFVSMSIKKTFTVGERKKVMSEKRLKELEAMYKDADWKGRPIDDIKIMLNQQKIEMKFLKNIDDNLEAVYYVDFVARGSNSFGAIIKNNYSATVLNDENLTVVHLKSMNN